MKILHLITARGGSKGLPGKNIKELGGKPLFMYSVEFAQRNMKDGDELCISTDDEELIALAGEFNVPIPFKRPAKLASDTATSSDVIHHALEFYTGQGKNFDAVLLLQPTSPLRADLDYENVVNLFSLDLDMVVSVKESKDSPYFNLFEERAGGFLKKSKDSEFERRQDCPPVYAYNGSMYLFNVKSFEKHQLRGLSKIKKVVMPAERSVDIDTMADWTMAQYYFELKK